MKNDMRLGHGGRFKALAEKLARKGVNDPKAVAAAAGRKAHGAAQMAKWSSDGRKRAGD